MILTFLLNRRSVAYRIHRVCGCFGLDFVSMITLEMFSQDRKRWRDQVFNGFFYLALNKSTCHIEKILIALWLASYVPQLFEEVVRSSHRSSKVYSGRGFNLNCFMLHYNTVKSGLLLLSICLDTHVISMIWCSASIIRWPAFSARAGSSSCLSPGKPNITIKVQPCQTNGKYDNSITTMVIFSR